MQILFEINLHNLPNLREIYNLLKVQNKSLRNIFADFFYLKITIPASEFFQSFSDLNFQA